MATSAYDQLTQRPKKFDVNTWAGQMDQERNAHTQNSLAQGQAAMEQAQASADAAKRRQNLVGQIPTGGMKAPAPDGSQNNPLNTELGRNVTNTLGALPGAAGVPGAAAAAGGLVARALGASAPAVSAAGQLAQRAAPYAPVAGGAAALQAASSPASAPSSPAPQGLAAADRLVPSGSQSPSGPSSSAPAALAGQPAPASGAVTRDGNSYSGTNVSGDITVNGRQPGGGFMVADGRPRNLIEAAGITPGQGTSAQNMQAADNLAARPQGLLAYAQANPPAAPAAGAGSLLEAAGLRAPVVRHSGNDWQARNDLRNLEVSASSITNRPEWQNGSSTQAWSTRGPTAKGDPQGKIAAYQSALAADIAARGAQPGVDLATMRENAGLQREGMQQQGANARAALTGGLEAQRVAIEQERANNESRAARQLEAQRSIAIDPRSTPEQRAAAERALMTLQGREAAPTFKSHVLPTTKNVDGSTTLGGVYQENTRTGEGRWVPQTGAAPQAPSVGTIQQGYRFKGGDPANPTSWEKA